MATDPVHMAELRAARAQARLDVLEEAEAKRRKAAGARKPSPRRDRDAARPRRYEAVAEPVNRLRRGLEATDPKGNTR